MGLLGLWTLKERMKTQRASWYIKPEPSQPLSLHLRQKKKRKDCFGFCCVYLRFRRMSAAAAATMMMTAAPMAIKVVAGIPLVGGMTNALGDGEAL
jgi:hypothetical protein